MYTPHYAEHTDAPSLEEIANLQGPAVLEFGTDRCPICQGAQRHIREALEPLPDLPHIKVEDGPGRRLGRHFRVKLWPTLIFLRDGREVSRTVRPGSAEEIRRAAEGADSASPGSG
jgi:thioredoxin 1